METHRIIVALDSDLPPGRSKSVRVGERRIALFNDGGELYALDEACPHMKADLSQGTLRNGVLACAWHGWRFDIRTGRGLTKDWACLKTHHLFREGDQLVLEIRESPSLPAEQTVGGDGDGEEE